MKSFKEFLSEAKTPDLETTYKKIKDYDHRALRGFARQIGVDDEAIEAVRRDVEGLMDEIMGYLYGDDWMGDLMKKGLI